jgi:hypothetical protein
MFNRAHAAPIRMEKIDMKTIDIRYECFECRKVKRQVIVNTIVLPFGNGDTMDAAADQNVAFDCNQKKDCGVLTEAGGKINIDWSECICSDLKDHRVPKIESAEQPLKPAAALQAYYSLMAKSKRNSDLRYAPSANPEADDAG